MRGFFRSLRTRAKQWDATRKGWATYIDGDGRVRYARSVKKGELVRIPIDHIDRVRKNGR
jgi:hypothetical protein